MKFVKEGVIIDLINSFTDGFSAVWAGREFLVALDTPEREAPVQNHFLQPLPPAPAGFLAVTTRIC